MSNPTKHFLRASALMIGLMQFAAVSHAQQASSFQKSCKDITYVTDRAGTPAIQASCQNAKGDAWPTSRVAIRGFHNQDGRLSAGAGVSSFQKSCEGSRVVVDGQHVKLQAKCRKIDGSMVDTSSIIYDVLNDDGKLRHKVPGNDTLVN